jgi:hypothetical protein
VGSPAATSDIEIVIDLLEFACESRFPHSGRNITANLPRNCGRDNACHKN